MKVVTRQDVSHMLADIRGDREYSGVMGKYAIATLESGRSSFPTRNMVTYCQDFDIDIIIFDDRLNRKHVVRTDDELHLVIRRIMLNRKTNYNRMVAHTGRNYTGREKDGKISMSIDTLLLIMYHLGCHIEFTKRKDL